MEMWISFFTFRFTLLQKLSFSQNSRTYGTNEINQSTAPYHPIKFRRIFLAFSGKNKYTNNFFKCKENHMKIICRFVYH